MVSFCYAQLDKHKVKFLCPCVKRSVGRQESCEAEWTFNLVRHVACFTKRELDEIESRLASMAMESAGGMQECPGCKNWCFRKNTANNRVICPFCSKQRKDGTKFEFCWQCLSTWKSGIKCPNPNCSDADPRIWILASCSE